MPREPVARANTAYVCFLRRTLGWLLPPAAPDTAASAVLLRFAEPEPLPARLADDLRRHSAALWQAHQLGILRGVRILPSDGCEVSEAKKATVYAIGKLPRLSLSGCTRSPHCACFYGAVLKDDEAI